MRSLTSLSRPLLGLLLACVASLALAQAKPRIDKAADLPRFSYKIDGKVEDVVRSADKFAPFAASLRRDTESVLAGYEIADKATRRNLLNLLLTLDYLDGRNDAVLARIEEMRALQDKPADKLLSSHRLKAMVQAGRNGASGDDYRRAVGEAIQRDLAALPYPVIENDIKGAKASAELIGETLILGRVREVLQPVVDEKGALSSDLAPGIVFARFSLVAMLPLKQTLISTYGTYLAAHQVAKADIWAARDVTLRPADVRAPVVIAVWDSGSDTRVFADQVLREGGQPAVIAFDRYSRPTTGDLAPLPPALQGKVAQIAARSKGFSDLRSNVDSKEAGEIKALLSGLPADQFRATSEELSFGGNYTHGTHVAGIALAGNPGARLVVARIDFGYTLKPDPCPSRELAEREAQAAQAYVDFMKRNKVRVANMSWSGDVGDIESDLEQCGIGKTAAERKTMAREFYEIQKAGLTKAFASAPEILFVAAAGNSNNDASFIESVPGGIALPNLLTVGAVDSAGEEVGFTSYGPTVKVHANGYQVESFLPGGSRVAFSGTSMAAPQVANLAGKLLAVNPKLGTADLIRIIVGTADRSADGRRVLINPKKAVAAATAA
ncbi:MAG: S8 family serine peptidase [Burkholderiales bacterium]|nr:S8 family serine peptidase [Burkholderiales bacterium]